MVKLKPAPVDPDVVAAEQHRDRVAAQFEDGVATEAAMRAAEAAVEDARAAVKHRAERAAGATRERERVAAEDEARAARWRTAQPVVREMMIEREVLAEAIELALAELVAAVEQWRALPQLSGALVDAPGSIGKRRDVDPIATVFQQALRPVASTLGLGPIPLAPPAFRAPLTEIIEQVHGPVWAAVEPEAK